MSALVIGSRACRVPSTVWTEGATGTPATVMPVRVRRSAGASFEGRAGRMGCVGCMVPGSPARRNAGPPLSGEAAQTCLGTTHRLKSLLLGRPCRPGRPSDQVLRLDVPLGHGG